MGAQELAWRLRYALALKDPRYAADLLASLPDDVLLVVLKAIPEAAHD